MLPFVDRVENSGAPVLCFHVFEVQLLKEAYQQEYTDAFTDDASVVEAMGREVCLVQGNRENIKLTTPFDLKIAEVLI